MRVLLTGATGYLGKHIAKKMIQERYELYCIVRKTSDITFIQEYVRNIYKIENNDELYEILIKIKPQLIIHVAGMFLGVHTRDNIQQMLESNIIFPTMLLDAADQAGCRCLINTSSYWQNFGLGDYDPVNLYAATKQALEDLVEYYKNANKWKVMTLQIFDVFGPNDPRKKILNVIRGLKDGEEIDMSPGEQKLYMCYIEDAVMAYMQAVRLTEYQMPGTCQKFAVRAQKAYTLKEIINTYLGISGKNVKINWGGRPYKDREFMDPEGVGNILIGWKPRYTLQTGLEKYVSGWVE